MRHALPRPVIGGLLVGFGITLLAVLPSSADEPVRYFFRSANGGYLEDLRGDATSLNSNKAPAGSTLSTAPPTRATDSQARSLSTNGGFPSTPITPTFSLPFTGTMSSICVDAWVRTSVPGHPTLSRITFRVALYDGTGTSATALGTAMGAIWSSATTDYRVTQLLKPSSGTWTVTAGARIGVYWDPQQNGPDWTMLYDSTGKPSSITVNATECGPGSLPSAAPSSPGGSPTTPAPTPSEATPTPTGSLGTPSGTPSATPSGSASPSGSPDPCGTGSPTPDPSLTPSAAPTSAAPTSAPPTPSPTPSASSSSPPPSGLPTTLPSISAPRAGFTTSPGPDPCTGRFLETSTTYTGPAVTRFAEATVLRAKVLSIEDAPVPTGSVKFTLGGRTVTGSLGEDGVATATMVFDHVAPGDHVLAVRYQGGTGFAPSGREAVVTVNRMGTTCSLARAVSSGKSHLTATLKSATGKAVSGATFVFAYDGRVFARVKTDRNGVAKASTGTGSRGHTFTATFATTTHYTGCGSSKRL